MFIKKAELQPALERETANEMVETITKAVLAAAKDIPQTKPSNGKYRVPWWNA